MKKNLLSLLSLISIAICIYFYLFHSYKNIAHEQIDFANKAWVEFEKAESFYFNKKNTSTILNSGKTSKSDVYLFFDFNCEKCTSQLTRIKKISEQKKLNLHLVYYPLSFYCNPNVVIKGEIYSCYYTQFLKCAQNQKADVYDIVIKLNGLIQTKQKQDPLKNIQDVATSMKLESETLKTCMYDPDWTRLKKSLADEKLKNKALSLPVLIVNDKMFASTQSDEAVDHLFQKLFNTLRGTN